MRGEQTQSQTIIVDASTPWAQQLEIWMTPHGFLKAAAANNATARVQDAGGRKLTMLTFTGPNKAQVNGYINEQNLVERVETRLENVYLGDMLTDAMYSEYKDFGGVKFPTRIVQRQAGHPIWELTVTDLRPNAPVSIYPPPPAAAGAAPAPGGAPPVAQLDKAVYLVLCG